MCPRALLKKCGSLFHKSIPTVSNKICWSRSIKVSETLPIVILWQLGCRQGLQPNASLSLLTDEVTADVFAQEILPVLSEIAFNTWAPQLILNPWESLPGARGLQTCILYSRKPTVWQNGGLGIFRMKLLSKKNYFHQHVCDAGHSHVEQWPCQVIAGESSYFSLLHNTLSPKLLPINLPFYWFLVGLFPQNTHISPHILWADFEHTWLSIWHIRNMFMEIQRKPLLFWCSNAANPFCRHSAWTEWSHCEWDAVSSFPNRKVQVSSDKK